MTADIKQPVVYHELPVPLWVGMMHAYSAVMVIDLTPQAGRLATWCVANRVGYVGICQTEFQKDYILKQAEAEVVRKLADPSSGISIPKFVNAEKDAKEGSKKRPGEDKPENAEAVEPEKKKLKVTPATTFKVTPATTVVTPKKDGGADPADKPEGSVKLSPALAKLLKAASSKEDVGAGKAMEEEVIE